MPYAERIFEEMQNAEKYILYEEGFSHDDFIIGDSDFIDRMVEIIEFGAIVRTAYESDKSISKKFKSIVAIVLSSVVAIVLLIVVRYEFKKKKACCYKVRKDKVIRI